MKSVAAVVTVSAPKVAAAAKVATVTVVLIAVVA